MQKAFKQGAGVMLDVEVVAFLAQLGGKEGRSRSWLINYIVRLHAQQLAAKQKDAEAKALTTIPF